MHNNDFAIIGAGITGLSVAFTLRENGQKADLFERKSEAGGAIKTCHHNEWQYECGPNTLLLKDSRVADFFEKAGLKDEIQVANEQASNRYIIKNGDPVTLPTSLSSFLRTPLFSGKAKWRLLAEPFMGKITADDPTLAEFVEKRLGREFLEYAANPFVAGIYAGSPDQLSLKHTFPMLHEMESNSLFINGIKKMFSKNRSEFKIPRKLISFKKGLHQLPKRISEQLESCYFNQDVKQILRRPEGWIVKTQMGNFGPYKNIIQTAPLYKWKPELVPATERQLEDIKQVSYSPISVMILGFRDDQIDHPMDGFGFLVPEKENYNILGGLFSSTLFPGRTPVSHKLLTVFIGGARQPELAEMESSELLKLVMDDLNSLLGVKGEPVFKDHIYWPNSIPQYEPGYDTVLDIFNQIEEKNPGYHIAGNFRNGVSVPDCILNGIELGKRLSRRSG